jgi:hypothetical protein
MGLEAHKKAKEIANADTSTQLLEALLSVNKSSII